MTLKDIESQLEQRPWGMERRGRHEFVMLLLVTQFEDMCKTLSLSYRSEKAKDFIGSYNTCVRYIQIAQKENPSLRGKDYDDGKALAEDKCLSLGYETGYKGNVKKLDTL